MIVINENMLCEKLYEIPHLTYIEVRKCLIIYCKLLLDFWTQVTCHENASACLTEMTVFLE